MAKKLNISAISSELSEGSAFFPGYKKPTSDSPPPVVDTPGVTKHQPPTPQINRAIPDLPTARPEDEATKRPTDRPTGKRILVRRGFEWYEDQLSALKKLSLQEQMDGKEGSMSAMVREAVDEYLKKRAAK